MDSRDYSLEELYETVQSCACGASLNSDLHCPDCDYCCECDIELCDPDQELGLCNSCAKELGVGSYYSKKDREAKRFAGQLAAAKKRNAPAGEIRRLENKLDIARFVGD